VDKPVKYNGPEEYPHLIAPIRRPHSQKADRIALRAVNEGVASPHQQQLAMRWIIYAACETYGMPYRPKSDADTHINMGKMHVGQSIVHMIKSATSTMDLDKASIREAAEATESKS
jgi:hypothetical protein